ncbi:hypothetical protein BsWGS_00341 [Bradybaena similaris]
MVSTSELTQIVTVLVSVGLFSDTTLGQYDDCRLQQSVVPISKHMPVTLEGRVVTAVCSRSVSLNKCEGTCQSSVTPSVLTHPGFRRNCRCCKETTTEAREVLLTCYRNGQEIPNFQQPIAVREITGCLCEDCND